MFNSGNERLNIKIHSFLDHSRSSVKEATQWHHHDWTISLFVCVSVCTSFEGHIFWRRNLVSYVGSIYVFLEIVYIFVYKKQFFYPKIGKNRPYIFFVKNADFLIRWRQPRYCDEWKCVSILQSTVSESWGVNLLGTNS